MNNKINYHKHKDKRVNNLTVEEKGFLSLDNSRTNARLPWKARV